MSYLIAFGMIYTMMVRQDHALSKMTALWLLPVVTLIVASSTGGLLSNAIREHSHTLALVTSGFSFTMVIIGLSFPMMIITTYLIRLITAGPPDAGLILSAFIVLGPLGQGGFSLLINGTSISELLPLHVGADFPQIPLAGQSSATETKSLLAFWSPFTIIPASTLPLWSLWLSCPSRLVESF